MKRTLYLFLMFCTCFLSGQNQIFKINPEEIYVADEKKLSNTDESKIKIKFSSLDNGNCFVFNRLLDGNKTGKVLSYFKEYGVVVVRSQNKLSYFTFKEAFPKGGFYKTNTTKNIFGKEATLYDFDNDVLKIQLWVATGTSEKSEFELYLKNMGLLQYIPSNSSVLAVNIMGLEFDTTDFKVDNERSYKSNLNDILVTFRELKDSLNSCMKENQPEAISLSQIDNKIKLSLDCKINYKIKIWNYPRDTDKEFNRIMYSNNEGTIDLELYDEPDSEGVTFIYTNTILNQEIVGRHEGSKFKIFRAKEINRNACQHFKEKLIRTENGLTTTFYGYDHEFGILYYEKNVKDYPNFQNTFSSNGLITKKIFINKYLDKQEYTGTVEKGSFTFTLEK